MINVSTHHPASQPEGHVWENPAAAVCGEARLRLAQEAADIGFWECDAASQAMSWSPEQCCLHGLDPADAPPTFLRWLDLVEPDDHPVIVAAGLALSGAGPMQMEFRIRRASDGARLWLASLGRVVPDGNGHPRLLGVTMNVTGQRQAEEGLRAANARQRRTAKAAAMNGSTGQEAFGRAGPDRPNGRTFVALADARGGDGNGHAREGALASLPAVALRRGGSAARGTPRRIGMGAADLDGKWTRVSAPFCGLLGYTTADLLSRTFLDVMHPDDIAATLEVIRRLLKGDATALGVTARFIRSDGSPLHAALTVLLIRHSDGTPRHFTMTVEAVPASVSRKAAARWSGASMGELFESAPLPNYLVDPSDASIVDCNDAAAAMLGYERDVLRGMLVTDIGVGADGEGADAAPWHPTSAGQPAQTGTILRTRSGEVRDVVVAAVPIAIGGRPLAHCTVIDITEHKRTEAGLRRLAERGAAQISVARTEHLATLAQISGGVAHDFNNLLQAVQGGAAMIERRPAATESVCRYARIVADAAARGASITARLLAFARRGDVCAEAVDLAATIEGMRGALAGALGPAISIQIQAEAALPLLLADKSQLETALVTLATNARDAMPRGGMLTLSAAIETAGGDRMHWAGISPGSYVRIVVGNTDVGNGNIATHAFQPFFTTKPPGQGVGLGLALVKVFAEQSGGGVAIDTAHDHATQVAIWLPLALDVLDVAGPCQAAPVTERLALAGGASVLVVDDDALVLEVLAAELGDGGFKVTTAANGTQALGLLDGGLPVHALVSDLSMPGMDGVSLIVEAQARRPSLPAVLLTGYAEAAVMQSIGNRITGPLVLARKPVCGSVLAGRLHAVIAEAGTASG
jgi:PAS domain S-box-containing protein